MLSDGTNAMGATAAVLANQSLVVASISSRRRRRRPGSSLEQLEGQSSAPCGELVRQATERSRDLGDRRHVFWHAHGLAARPELGQEPHPLLEDSPRGVAVGEQVVHSVE